MARWYGAERAVPPTRRVRDVDLARHRVARVHARAPVRALRALRADPRDEPVPRARRRAARARAAARDARGGLAPRRRAREAAPGEDVAARRRRPHDDAAPRPVAARRRLARGPVPGASGGVRPEQRARDRVDARRDGDGNARGERARALPDARGSRASTSTTRRTGSAPSGSSPPGRHRCPRSGALRMLSVRENRVARDPVLRRGLASVDLPQGDHRRRARRLGRDHRLARVAARPRGDRRGSRAARRRAGSAAGRGGSTGISTARPGRARVASSRRRSPGSRTRCSTSRRRRSASRCTSSSAGRPARRSRCTGRTAARRARARSRSRGRRSSPRTRTSRALGREVVERGYARVQDEHRRPR